MNYKERILYIANICTSQNIPFSINTIFDGWQIRFPWCVGDIACHFYTHGAADGLVESYRFPWDGDDTSALTPEEAASKVAAHYEYVWRSKEDTND